MRKLKFGIVILFLIWGTPRLMSAQEVFDKFSDLSCEDLKGRLDRLAIAVRSDPNVESYIIVYGGKHGWRGETQAWMKMVKDYLFNNRNITAQSLTIINGGYQKLLTMELWVLPKGGSPPKAFPTILPKDVRFKLGRIPKNICGEE